MHADDVLVRELANDRGLTLKPLHELGVFGGVLREPDDDDGLLRTRQPAFDSAAEEGPRLGTRRERAQQSVGCAGHVDYHATRVWRISPESGRGVRPADLSLGISDLFEVCSGDRSTQWKRNGFGEKPGSGEPFCELLVIASIADFSLDVARAAGRVTKGEAWL